MVSLARGTTTAQPAFNFHQNEDGNFCLCCCCRSLRLLWCHLGQRQLIVCVACPASVLRVTHGTIVTWLFFYCFTQVLYLVFCCCSRVLVAGDLRHEYAQSAWGFLFWGPPDCCLCLLHLRCGDWHSFDDDCCHGMSIGVIILTSSRRLCCVRRQGRLVAPRLIPTALLIALDGRWLISWALWCFTMMLSTMSIAISDGFQSCPLQLAMASLPVVACCNCA